MKHDTIVAIATALGEGAVGIIRLSGPAAPSILRALFCTVAGRPVPSFQPRRLRIGRIVDPETGDTVDEVLAVYFPAPHSYTAEDVVEIHGHGGPVALQRVLELALRHGARAAEPGEFTLRALLNGRIDLAQAEAVADVIAARSAAALRSAVAGLTGRLSDRIHSIRRNLLALMAYLTARVDFPEEDIPEHDVVPDLLAAATEVARLIDEGEQGRVLRYGVRTAIVGRPNAGKSSLLNRLLGAARAIVTAVPGTTRDTIEETLVLRGVPFVLVDTAGIQSTEDEVERIGINRSRAAIDSADLAVFVVDGSQPLQTGDREVAGLLGQMPTLLAVNKCDLLATDGQGDDRLESVVPAWLATPVIGTYQVSALTGEGIAELEAAMVQAALGGRALASEAPLVTNPRHVAALREAADYLRSAVEAQQTGVPTDFVRLDVGSALTALGTITGETLGENLLDEVFQRFCIGK